MIQPIQSVRRILGIALLAICHLAGTAQAGDAATQPIGAPLKISSESAWKRGGTDKDLQALPDSIEELSLRGFSAFGSDKVTDDGIANLARCTRLRVLHAIGLDLTDRALESIGKLQSLQELRLESNRITSDGLQPLLGLKSLRKLYIGHNALTPEAFGTLCQLGQLTVLSVGNTCPVTDAILKQCAKLQNLEELNLDENVKAVTDAGLASLASLKRLTNVDLYEAPKVTDAGLAQLGALNNLRILKVDPRGLKVTRVTAEGLRFLENLVELRVLEIAEVPLDERVIRSIGKMPHLEELLLWNVGPDSIALEALGNLKSLRTLRTNQTIRGPVIRAMGRLASLESIGDQLTEVSDDDLTYLAQLPNLRKLELGGDKLTSASLQTLAKMKSLRLLRVTDSVPISPDQWKRLGEVSLPDCRIEQLSPASKPFYVPPTK